MMKKRRILGFFMSITLVISALGMPVWAEEPSAVMTGTEKLDTAGMADLLTRIYGATSVQYALLHEGEIVESGTSGVYSRTEDRPLTRENLYGIGSISKVYTAAAAMKLAEQGKLRIEEPVVTYLPEFTMADERYREITVQMLMNHSSGLPGMTYTNTFLYGDTDSYAHDHLLEALKSQRLKADPGAYSVYCNDGFTLLELVVERVSGLSFTEFLHQEFFVPGGLTASMTPQDSFDRSLLARTYLPLFPQETPEDTAGIIGTGGIYASAEDVCRFGEILYGGRPEILTGESAQRMMEPEYKNGIWAADSGSNALAYGLGWDSVDLYPFGEAGIQALTKGGDTMLYHGALVVLPEYRLTAAVLSSGGSSGYDTILAAKMIENYMLAEGMLAEELPIQTFTPAEKQAMPEELKAYSGLYGTAGATLAVVVDNDELRVPSTGEGIPEQVYPYTGEDTFQSPDGSVRLYFTTEENGETYLVLDAYGMLPGIGMTRSYAYNVQRFEKNPVPDAVLEAWTARDGRDYLLLTEKATSQLMTAMPVLTVTVDEENGYAVGCRIVDEDLAVNAAQIPMSAGRDTFDLSFFREGDREFMSVRGMTYLSEEAIPAIYVGLDGVCTIQPEGYTRWYNVPERESAMKMEVGIPDGGTVYLYDAKNNCVENSVITGSAVFSLPEGGRIAFSAEAGAVFEVAVYAETEE